MNAVPSTLSPDIKRRLHGFRFSLLDTVALLVCAAVVWFGWPFLDVFVLFAPLALGHFFLFCNIFRVRTRLELIWATLFVANVIGMTFFTEVPHPGLVALVQTPVTLLVLFLEIRSREYHGIGAQTINPNLENYLQQRAQKLGIISKPLPTSNP